MGFYLDSTLGLHKPAAQHCLDLAVSQLAVGRLDLPLHRLLQQQTPQTPVKELTGRLPFKDILRWAKDKRNNVNAATVIRSYYLLSVYMLLNVNIQVSIFQSL